MAVKRHEVQVREYVYGYVGAQPTGQAFQRSAVQRAVMAGLALNGRDMRALPGASNGALSDGISRTLRKMERRGEVVRVDTETIIRLPRKGNDPERLLTFLRTNGPTTMTRIEAAGPPMRHKVVLLSLNEVGLVWRVGNEWVACDDQSMDGALLGQAHRHLAEVPDPFAPS